jgi:hypothetical protein
MVLSQPSLRCLCVWSLEGFRCPHLEVGALLSRWPPTPETQARFVKSVLRSQGYPRSALSQLPEDNSQGSRELLLALSWLLARGPLLERLLAQTRVHLGDHMPQWEVSME